MSKFLGPIHYWLYGKIEKQEALTKAFAEYATGKGWIGDGKTYTKDLFPLEEAIDESNIHGWLQSQIHDAETRYANLVCVILKADEKRIGDLKQVAFDFGKRNVVEVNNATEAYSAFENFFVNGMPCDRVNVVTKSADDKVIFEMTQDIHAPYWKNGYESSVYYELRKSVMDGLLDGMNLQVMMSDTAHYCIQNK